MNTLPQPQRRFCVRGIVAGAALVAVQGAMAQFNIVPSPSCKAPNAAVAESERAFRIEAARHLYSCYPMRIFRGKLPPLLYGVMIVDTELDTAGNVVNVTVVRKPAADEVGPWVQAIIKRASPYPAPARISGATFTFTEIFMVDKSGLFQTDSLTEGQR